MNASFLLRPSPTEVGFCRRRSADFAPPPSNVAGTFDVPPKEEKSSTLRGSDLEGIPRALARVASFYHIFPECDVNKWKITIPNATETFNDSFLPCIGISNTLLHSFNIGGVSPLISPPRTKTTLE